jgi:hypothetical protein
MRCADVTRELSNADGRVTRRREIRAHLRGCADCRAFRDDMAKRHEDLAALSPLPLAAAAALLQGVLGGAAATGGAVGGGGLAGGVGAGAGQAVATSSIVKSIATVAVVAAAGVSAADRGGLIDLPIPDKNGTAGAAQDAAEPRHPPGPTNPAAGANVASPRAGIAAGRSPTGIRSGDRDEEGQQGKDGPGGQTQETVATAPGNGSSNSQAGLSPPGGGYGRAASKGQGRPDGPPDAADHGQQTATANKTAHAASPPGKSASGGSQGNGGGGNPSAPEPGPLPKAKAPSAVPAPQPSAATAPAAGDDLPRRDSGSTPPGLQR